MELIGRRSWLWGLVAGGVFLLAPLAGRAALIDLGGSVLDDQTGVEWHKVPDTVGLSIQDLLDGVGNSFLADGWRLATTGEVCGLVLSYQAGGLGSLGSCPGDTGYLEFVDGGEPIREALGLTYYSFTPYDPINDDGPSETAGLVGAYDDGDPSNGAGLVASNFFSFGGAPGPRSEGRLAVLTDSWGLAESESNAGLFLVRASSVPAPGVTALVAVGALGLALRGRPRRE